MNYIGLLTKEEKSTLCEIITGKEFKELFKRNEQEFAKVQKGFRAKSLTEQHALSIAITNIDKPFIATWVNMRVEHWLKEIEENIAKLEGEGLSHGAALATTMLDSFFVNNVELYFKLTGAPLDTDACSNLYERMEDIKSERARNVETSNRIRSMEEENQRLSNQVEESQHSINAIKAECEKKIQEIEQDKNQLASLLAEAQAKISELQTAPSAFASDDADYLARFDDTDASILPSDNADEIVSLCSVVSDYNGQKWLIRYADLNNNGHYYIFHRNEDIPPYFTNRDKIFYNLLAGGWMNRLPEILFQKDIFYMATHPYAEDVQVEPKSLYSFTLPLFTEFLVDKKATGKYYGGYFSDDFKPYLAGKGARKELTILSKLGLSSLVRSKINSLMATIHNIYPSTTTDDDFLFFIFPISYASMAINELAAAIADPQKSIEISANLKRDLQHVLGEN